MNPSKKHIWRVGDCMELYSNYDCKKLCERRKNPGQASAKELGIHCYDRELLRMASEQSGINEALFGQVDEKIKSSPLFRISKKIYKERSPLRTVMISLPRIICFNFQAQCIKSWPGQNPALSSAAVRTLS